MSTITPIKQNIFFIFDDEAAGGGFNNKTTTGLIYRSFDHDLNTARTGRVLAVGPDCKFVNKGDRIMIEKLQWTEGIRIDDSTVWMTTEEKVLFIINE
jgi:co-chaperonin GroES (HSP10)